MGDREDERLGLVALVEGRGERLRLDRAFKVVMGSRCVGLSILGEESRGLEGLRSGSDAVICRCRARTSAVLLSTFARRLVPSEAATSLATLLLLPPSDFASLSPDVRCSAASLSSVALGESGDGS